VDVKPFWGGWDVRAARALACVSSKCWSSSGSEASVRPQQVTSDSMNAAFILDRDDDGR
jgi:hypothetical protein